MDYEFDSTVYRNSDNLGFIALNTLPLSSRCRIGCEEGDLILNWLENILKEDRDWVINMHFYPGVEYHEEAQELWTPKNVERFQNMKNLD